mmetsp:Transcript_80745/g.231980  ORF Transcript_80745/g.231980 Transcript_80745/m.231980 type:complete len:455 (+) Transcript_80745:59-1423(+)
MSARVSICLNDGPRQGQPQALLVVQQQMLCDALLQTAASKLRLKAKDIKTARLFVWGTGVELPRGAELADLLHNNDLVAVSLGEPYAGPTRKAAKAVTEIVAGPTFSEEIPPSVSGFDDTGREIVSLAELWALQAQHAAEYYAANDAWWEDDGYAGATDDEAMIGDTGSAEDVEHSQRLLDGVLSRFPGLRLGGIMDGGAGVGRVTKAVLMRKCVGTVTLVESCERWLKQARRYLGNKRSQRCVFVQCRLEEHTAAPGSYDLVWLQWCLQYLVDAHVVSTLRNAAAALAQYGMIVVKENRPMAKGQEERFQVDTPGGPNGRHDITRPDEHHRWLFRCAGLEVEHWEHADETTAWVLRPASALAPLRPEVQPGWHASTLATGPGPAPAPAPAPTPAPPVEDFAPTDNLPFKVPAVSKLLQVAGTLSGGSSGSVLAAAAEADVPTLGLGLCCADSL